MEGIEAFHHEISSTAAICGPGTSSWRVQFLSSLLIQAAAI
jgi:hypothetical protein